MLRKDQIDAPLPQPFNQVRALRTAANWEAGSLSIGWPQIAESSPEADETRERRDTLKVPDLSDYVDQGGGWFTRASGGPPGHPEPASGTSGWFSETEAKTHSNSPSRAGSELEANDKFRDGILARHNSLRAQHGAPPLEWSDQCAANAQLQADACAERQSLFHGNHAGQGQNVRAGCSGMVVSDWWYGCAGVHVAAGQARQCCSAGVVRRVAFAWLQFQHSSEPRDGAL